MCKELSGKQATEVQLEFVTLTCSLLLSEGEASDHVSLAKCKQHFVAPHCLRVCIDLLSLPD